MSTGKPREQMTWRELPTDRRRKLAVLVGRLAARCLQLAVETKEADHDAPLLTSSGHGREGPQPPP
jgi:hypothetical protein